MLTDLIYFSRSNEITSSQEDSKLSVLKPTPLKRGRMQRPKPNLGRTVARKDDQLHKKDAEEEKAENGEAEKVVIHHRDEDSGSCLKSVSFLNGCIDCIGFCWGPNRSF